MFTWGGARYAVDIYTKYHSPFSGELVHFHSFVRGVNVIGPRSYAENREKKVTIVSEPTLENHKENMEREND